MTDIIPYLERLCARIAQPEMRNAFHGFSKIIQFTFPDLQRDFTLSIAEDGDATLAEQTVPQPDITVTTGSDVLAGIMDGAVNPMQVYIARKLQVTGKMEDLLKLQRLL